MEIHELCQLFPEMSSHEFAEFCADVAKHGVIDPLVTHEGKILDGRHRYRVSLSLGCPLKFEEWRGQGGSPLAFVVSRNLHRRSLTTAQRAAISLDVKERLNVEYRERMVEAGKAGGKIGGKIGGNGRTKRDATIESRGVIKNDNPSIPRGNAQREAAAMMNVSVGSVHAVEKIRAASPETFEAVKAGRVTIPEAKRQIAATMPPKPPVVATVKAKDESEYVLVQVPRIDHPKPPPTIMLTQKVEDDFQSIISTASPEYIAQLGRRLIEWAELNHHAKDV